MTSVPWDPVSGGYEENADDDPPRTLARSASDSTSAASRCVVMFAGPLNRPEAGKLDCTSSASSVLFWYPQLLGLVSKREAELKLLETTFVDVPRRGGGSMSRSNSSALDDWLYSCSLSDLEVNDPYLSCDVQ